MMRYAAPIAMAALIAASAPAADPAPRGYLPPHSIDLTRIVPPAPSPGDIRYEADRKTFKAMKRSIGGPRWAAATADVAYDTPSMLADFGCAAGMSIDPASAPATTRLLDRASFDTGLANNDAKEQWRHARPFRIDPGRTCQPPQSLGASFDYPSGHTTKGWTFGLILAALLPDRATPILARARAYGESRIVCRVHNESAVEAGRLGATAVMAAVRETPAFAVDLAAARAEITRLRTTAAAPDPARCATEAAVLSPSVLAALRR